MGWYDQYARLDGTPNIEDVVIGLEGETIVAVALTYIPNTGSPTEDDLPWAKTIGADVGSWQHYQDLAMSVAHSKRSR
ncbi:hypothetical protein COL922a_001635 [Colletotrichum nupharicola]|nr:hypothetical protein COL922a_001635 [Colletotrichum nupharicola]